ncbi:MAG: hypothetical protein AMXMBFR46_26490 [Acidimicrobiia bacterium]
MLAMLMAGTALVVLAAAPSSAALSDDDCEAVTNLESGSDSSSRELAVLKAQAEGFANAAKKISDKKLKKALALLADVYEDASKAKNTAAAGLVLLKRAKDFSKSFSTYAKALNECTLRSLSTLSSRVTLPPNVTLPSNVTLPPNVTLPSNITLPPNLTLPSLPRR